MFVVKIVDVLKVQSSTLKGYYNPSRIRKLIFLNGKISAKKMNK